jgi:hypothetical protein
MTVPKPQLSREEFELLEYIKDDIPDIDDELFQDILENGIETVDQWEDAYVCTMPTSIRVEAQFVEQLMDDLGYLSEESDVPDFITSHIDWQEVWDCELTHDYFIIESPDCTHFFSRHF